MSGATPPSAPVCMSSWSAQELSLYTNLRGPETTRVINPSLLKWI